MMKKIALIFILMTATLICNAQRYVERDNNFTIYYGIENSILFEYGRYLKEDRNQLVGIDIGIGHVFNNYADLKATVGFRGLVLNPSEWNFIYKMGLVFYDFKSYDVFMGVGVEKNRFHIIGKLNLMQTIGFNNEWAEFGIGFSF